MPSRPRSASFGAINRSSELAPPADNRRGFPTMNNDQLQANLEKLLGRFGAAVLRFSGREIARDAAGCAREVWSYLSRNATFSEDRAA